jgi:hypothetical protein
VRSEDLRSVDLINPGVSDGGLPLPTRPDDDDVAFYAEHGWRISPKVLSDDFIYAAVDAIEQQFAADGRTVTRVPFRLRKGQVSFHHGWTLYASLPNTSARVRLALAVHLRDVDNRYQPARTPDGRPIRMFDELLCRVQPNGEPDFTDPDVFPTIWPVH